MEWLPVESAYMLSEALPLLRFAVPNVLFPSLNVTLPPGVPAALLTATVKVTAWPNTDGLTEELTVVEVGACPLTTCDNTVDVLGWKFVAPPKTVVMP